MHHNYYYITAAVCLDEPEHATTHNERPCMGMICTCMYRHDIGDGL